MRVKFLHRLFLFPLLIASFSHDANAQNGFEAQADIRSNVSLISQTQGVGDSAVIKAGFKIELPDGWYTYWRMPGDAGLPPRLDWTGSENFKEAQIIWPAPKRFETAGMQSFGYGYGGDVYLPLDITLQEPGAPFEGIVTLDMMICEQICIPETHELRLSIPAGRATPTEYISALSLARTMAPNQTHSRLSIENVVLSKDALVVTVRSRDGFENIDLFIETQDQFLNTKPELQQGQDEDLAVLKVTPPDGIENLTNELFGQAITLTVVHGNVAVEKSVQF